MKKIFALFVITFGLVSSTFALGLSAGATGNIGANLKTSDIIDDGFSGGAGAYLNLDLFFGIGLQGEINYVTSPCSLLLPTGSISKYSAMDLAIMPWYSLNLVILSIGAGAGINFAFYDQNLRGFSIIDENFIPGITFTINGKIYLGEHLGLVIGAHGVFDILPMVDISQLPDSYFKSNPNITDLFRRSIYGTVGVEFRL